MILAPKNRILVVDDAQSNIRLLLDLLGKEYQVFVATNGEDALRVAHEQKPDLILLDVMMPVMDGFEVCKQLKLSPDLVDIPVIFITASDAIEDEAKGLAVGAIDYISKPFNTALVLARVKNHISYRCLTRKISMLHARNELILNTAGEGIIGLDENCCVSFVNPVAAKLLGWKVEDLVGQPMHGVFHICWKATGEIRDQEHCPLHIIFDQKEVFIAKDDLFWRLDGVALPVEFIATPLLCKDGVIQGAVIVFRDITARKEQEKKDFRAFSSQIAMTALLETGIERLSVQKQLEVALDIIHTVPWLSVLEKGSVYLVDEYNKKLVLVAQRNLLDNHITVCQEVALGTCLCGKAAQDKSILFCNSVDDRHELRYQNMMDHGHYCVPIVLGEKLIGLINLYVEVGHQNMAEEEAFLSTFAMTLANLIEHRKTETQLEEARHELQYNAHYDHLTGLPNRFLLKELLVKGIAMANRNQCRLAIMFVDLDRFKPVNDQYGHEIGDGLLVEVAKRLKKCLRESDVVARIGGDEFIIVLPEIIDRHDPALVAAKLLQEMNRPFIIQGITCEISCSIGIALYPEHGKDDESLLKKADMALYRVKETGRSNFLLYEE